MDPVFVRIVRNICLPQLHHLYRLYPAAKQKSNVFKLEAQRHLPTMQLSILQLFLTTSSANNTLKTGFQLKRGRLPLTGSSGETWFSRTIWRCQSVGCPLHFVRHWSVAGYDAVATRKNRGYSSFKNVFYSIDTVFEISQTSVFLSSRKPKTSRTDSFPLWSMLLDFDFPRLSAALVNNNLTLSKSKQFAG